MEELEDLSPEQQRKVFQIAIRKILTGKSSGRIIELSWRCTLRTLPYIAFDGDFSLDEKTSQEELYFILSQLDIGPSFFLLNVKKAEKPASEEFVFDIADVVLENLITYYANMEISIRTDLKAMLEDKPFPPLGSFSLFGDVWHQFRIALAAEGCDYWGSLYEEIYEKGVDIEKLKNRLAVPEDIKAKGVAAVGKYLKSLETEKE